MNLNTEHFATLFKAAHNVSPYLWQTRLVSQILEQRRWPTHLNLPTGTGKTAAIDVALFAFAALPNHMPRRICYVVDRRIIVDQVSARAKRLADALEAPECSAINQALQDASGTSTALIQSSLRGGVSPDNSWARRPDTPAIIAATVDQIGSRLLFRGYGVSQIMQPIHAGLLGNDCLYLLDEVHISQPFAQTLRTLESKQTVKQLPYRWQVVEMSATPRATEEHTSAVEKQFSLDAEDRNQLHTILRAGKPVQIVDIKVANKRGLSNQQRISASLVQATVLSLSETTANTIGVMVNRVATAVESAKKLSSIFEVQLLTGRMRSFEKHQAVLKLQKTFAPSNTHRPEADPSVLVATQTIEVGADLSFEKLVTEIAPVDSLKQRFGRVDRQGKLSAAGLQAEIDVLIPSTLANSKDPDPVYGDALKSTATWLHQNHAEGFNASIENAALDSAPRNCYSPHLDSPILANVHMDAWCQSNPAPSNEPQIADWLHGLNARSQADVDIVWRADIDVNALAHIAELKQADKEYFLSNYTEAFKIFPPQVHEKISVSISAVKRWLSSGEIDSSLSDFGSSFAEPENIDETLKKPFIRLSHDGVDILREPVSLRAGDTIIVPCSYGGLYQFNWSPENTEEVPDIAHAQLTAPHGLRFHPEVLRQLGLPKLPELAEDALESPKIEIASYLQACANQRPDLADFISSLDINKLQTYSCFENPDNQQQPASVNGNQPPEENTYFCVEAIPLTKARFDGKNLGISHTGKQVSLANHLDDVAEMALNLAKNCHLAPEMANDLALYGALHDIGKTDPRFQLLLREGDLAQLAVATEDLAKSDGTGQHSLSLLPDKWRYPKGRRHELLSLEMVSSSGILDTAHDRQLVEYLIASHHGYCRPFSPLQQDHHPRDVSLDRGDKHYKANTSLSDSTLSASTAIRFWDLVERYGWHGLAWLESIARLADHHVSHCDPERSTPGENHD